MSGTKDEALSTTSLTPPSLSSSSSPPSPSSSSSSSPPPPSSAPIAAEEDAKSSSEPTLAERIEALEAWLPVHLSLLKTVQMHFPHSMAAGSAVPAAAGEEAPTGPAPAPVWDAASQQWVIPTGPATPPPNVVWDGKTKTWKLAA